VSWQYVALKDVRPVPWKNGGGITHELLAWPPGLADWHWRISVAQVDADGPFSVFEGVQRWFAVLGGAGVELALGQDEAVQTQCLTQQSEAFCFDGSLPVDCKLINGPTQDFNLMVHRTQVRAHLQRVRGALIVPVQSDSVCALWTGATGAQLGDANRFWPVPAHTLAWMRSMHAQTLRIDTTDGLYMEIVPCL
jgi:environmental stress-induced protein Ves